MAVGYATVLDLDDTADAILGRERIHRLLGDAGTDAFLPLTDPRYDVPTDGSPPGPIAGLPALPGARPVAALPEVEEKAPVGSNGWAAGAGRTTTGRAVLANDPHLSLGIPTIWWLVEARSPGFHVAGAALAGTPGVTLGHDEHLAWGVTAGETAAMRLLRERARGADELFEHGRWVRAAIARERYGCGWAADVDADILETPHGTLIAREGDDRLPDGLADAARRPARRSTPSSRLDQAGGVDGRPGGGPRACPSPPSTCCSPTTAAGSPTTWPAASRSSTPGAATPSTATRPRRRCCRSTRAPHVDPSRDALVVTSNNRAGGAGGERLAPFWPPPYRAYELRRALAAARDGHGRLSPEALAAAQRDAELAGRARVRPAGAGRADARARGVRSGARARRSPRCASSTARCCPSRAARRSSSRCGATC